MGLFSSWFRPRPSRWHDLLENHSGWSTARSEYNFNFIDRYLNMQIPNANKQFCHFELEIQSHRSTGPGPIKTVMLISLNWIIFFLGTFKWNCKLAMARLIGRRFIADKKYLQYFDNNNYSNGKELGKQTIILTGWDTQWTILCGNWVNLLHMHNNLLHIRA